VPALFKEPQQVTSEFLTVNDFVLLAFRSQICVLFLHVLETGLNRDGPFVLLATFCANWRLMSPHDVDNVEGLKSAVVAIESGIYTVCVKRKRPKKHATMGG